MHDLGKKWRLGQSSAKTGYIRDNEDPYRLEGW